MVSCCFSYADEITRKWNGTYPKDAAITLRELLKYDLLVFLGYVYDPKSSEPVRQVAFVNEILQIKLTPEQFFSFREENSLDPHLLERIPDSLKYFVKDDLSPESRRSATGVSISRFIVNSYRDLGLAFIAFAGISDEESQKITDYINILNDYLKSYGLYNAEDPLRKGMKSDPMWGMPRRMDRPKPRPDANVDMTVAASYFQDEPEETKKIDLPGRGKSVKTARADRNEREEREEREDKRPGAKQEAKREDKKQEKAPEPMQSTLEELLEELNQLIGLQGVKKSLNNMINVIRVRKMREKMGLAQPDMSMHLVFSGNPGTGKTTVARLLAKIYRALGVVSKGQLVEVDRAGLVEGYVGQTAAKTNEVIDSAMGGVLFIDEAYTLTNKKESGDFGQEAVDTLLKRMEDDRKDFVVIVAGYTEPMEEFLESNPGLRSRFNKFIDFSDYSPQELYNIFYSMCSSHDFHLDEEADATVKAYFEKIVEEKTEHFANAREVRNFFERCIERQANRLVKDTKMDMSEITTFTAADVREN